MVTITILCGIVVLRRGLSCEMAGEMHVITKRALLSSLPEGRWCHRDVLLAFLLGRKGAWVGNNAIIEEIWSSEPDGGPLSAGNMTKVYVHQLRRSGWNIKTWSKVGYCLVGRSSPGSAPKHAVVVQTAHRDSARC